MNEHPMNPSPSPSAPPKDLFFRLADRLQIDACLEAIEQDGKSVILHGISPGLLDHYSQILVQRLRKRLPDTPTEIFFPTHTEALIARFNDLLEDVSVDAATQNQGPQAPHKLWIVHDASALPEHELKLLLRLLQHLPGARVSAVLVLNGQAAALRNLDPQGRRLMRWEIEPPTQAQIDQMVEEARQAGREFAALELIARLQTAPPAQSRETPRPPLTPSAPAALGALGAATPGPASADAAPPAAPARRSGGRTLTFVVAGVLLVLSAGVASWLHPEVVQGLIGSVARTPAVPAAAPASEPAPSASNAASSPAIEAASAAASTAPEASAATEAASAPVIPASQAQPAASAPSAAASAPATAGAPAPVQAASAPKVISELPDAAQNGLQWLRKLEADTWVIEHGRHPTAQAARKQISADKLLANARIVPMMQPGVDTAQFLVVTGPFRSMDRARTYMARNELGKSAALHDVNTLKTLTPPGPSTTRRP